MLTTITRTLLAGFRISHAYKPYSVPEAREYVADYKRHRASAKQPLTTADPRALFEQFAASIGETELSRRYRVAQVSFWTCLAIGALFIAQALRIDNLFIAFTTLCAAYVALGSAALYSYKCWLVRNRICYGISEYIDSVTRSPRSILPSRRTH